MQYSLSKVGIIGPPILVNFKVPLLVIDLTIAPNVSTCAARPMTFSFDNPSIVIMPFPLLVVSNLYPNPSDIFLIFSIISKQNPVGLLNFNISSAVFNK